MSISTVLKSVAAAITGGAFRTAIITDMTTLENEANRVAAQVDAQHDSAGSHKSVVATSVISPVIILNGVQRTSWPAASGAAANLNDVVQNGASANLPAGIPKFAVNDPSGVTEILSSDPAFSFADQYRGKGLAEQFKSVALSRSLYEDTAATIFTEAWASMANWTMPATPGMQVSGGAMYSTGAGGSGSGGNHSYALLAADNLRAVFKVVIPASGGGGGIIVGVSKDAAGVAPAASAGNVFGLFFPSVLGSSAKSYDSGVATDLIGQQAITAGTYIVTVTVDQTYISVAACKTDGTGETLTRRLRAGFAVNNLYLFNSDTRALTGISCLSMSARKGLQTITPRTFGEGYKTIQWTGDGSQGFTVHLPANYDSRIPSPLAICFHGNGTDESQWDINTNMIKTQEALTAAGYIVLGCSLNGWTTTWGNAASTAAYYAAYKYVRDHYAIGPVVFYANSMGGIESLNALAENLIPGVVAWCGTSATTNLANNYANATFTAVITAAYYITGGNPYATATAGRDPNLLPAYSFRKLPMLFLAATDDAAVDQANNTFSFYPKMALVSPYVYSVPAIVGGHGFDLSPYLAQIITFFDTYTKSS